MYSLKENSSFLPPQHFKTPYSRPNNVRTDPTICKILKKPRTVENNYGRSLFTEKAFGLTNPHPNVPVLQNFVEHPVSYATRVTYDSGNEIYKSNATRIRPEYEPIHFRPRKSQLANRMLENSFDQSLELKMMTIDDNKEIIENSKKPKFKTVQETPSKGFQIKTRQNLLRIFTGSVENVLHWSKLKTSLHILFEVTATVESIQQGKWKSEKRFCLSDSESGLKLQVVYHEIDRPLPKLTTRSLVTCTGRLKTRNLLQAFKVQETTPEQKTDLQRLSFICNRVADELVAANQKKEH